MYKTITATIYGRDVTDVHLHETIREANLKASDWMLADLAPVLDQTDLQGDAPGHILAVAEEAVAYLVECWADAGQHARYTSTEKALLRAVAAKALAARP